MSVSRAIFFFLAAGRTPATQAAAHPDVGAAFKVQALQLRSGSTRPLQAFHDLRATDVQTLGEVHTRQRRQGQKVGEACGQRDAVLTADGSNLHTYSL